MASVYIEKEPLPALPTKKVYLDKMLYRQKKNKGITIKKTGEKIGKIHIHTQCTFNLPVKVWN